MEADFWHNKWKSNDIGFHVERANPALVDHISALKLPKAARLFLPLCGKTLDIGWLLENGYQVVGAELNELAVRQLFEELDVEPSVETFGELIRFSAPGLDIYQGDIFALDRETLGPIAAIYDRAALVALPEVMRDRYTAHLIEISETAPQLLLAFVYDQTLAEGPPFSVDETEVERQYQQHYSVHRLETKPVPNGLKGKYPAVEHVWLLTPNDR